MRCNEKQNMKNIFIVGQNKFFFLIADFFNNFIFFITHRVLN